VTERPDDPERTRELKLPPVPGRPAPVEPAPAEPVPVEPAPVEPAEVLADQPTDQLPSPEARQPTHHFGPWQPLQPRVVPGRRSRTPYVVGALVVLVLVVGVVAVLVWG
jgi:hypothetical protein